MVSPGGVIIILIFIFILLLLLLLWGSERDPGAASGKGSGGSGRTLEAPDGTRIPGAPGGSQGLAGSTGAGLREDEQSQAAKSRAVGELLCRGTPVLPGVGGLVWKWATQESSWQGREKGVTGLWQFPVAAGVSSSLSEGESWCPALAGVLSAGGDGAVGPAWAAGLRSAR